MAIRQEQRQRRAQLRDEYTGARKQVFGLLSDFVAAMNDDSPAGKISKDIMQRAVTVLQTKIDSATQHAPARSKHMQRGDTMAFAQILDCMQDEPGLDQLDTLHAKTLMDLTPNDVIAGDLPETAAWKRITDEQPDIKSREIYVHLKVYYLCRLTLNSFIVAATETMKPDPRTYFDPEKTKDAHNAAIKHLNAVGNKFGLRFLYGD